MTFPKVYLEILKSSHQDEFIEAVKRSRELHYPWSSPPSTPVTFAKYIVKSENNYIRWAIRNHGGEMVGVITVSEIVRGAFQSAYFGYFTFAPYQGKGYMKQGLSLAITEAFTEYQLHRLEANIQPGNTTSMYLVESLGVRHEGFSPRYLFINGKWQDHERYAITVEEWSN